MKGRKITAAVIAALLSLTAASGCSGEPSERYGDREMASRDSLFISAIDSISIEYEDFIVEYDSAGNITSTGYDPSIVDTLPPQVRDCYLRCVSRLFLENDSLLTRTDTYPERDSLKVRVYSRNKTYALGCPTGGFNKYTHTMQHLMNLKGICRYRMDSLERLEWLKRDDVIVFDPASPYEF